MPPSPGSTAQTHDDNAAACTCKAEQTTIEQLLAQLAVAARLNKGLKENLLRAKYHKPVLLTSPLAGTVGVWQLCSALLALLLVASQLSAWRAARKAADRERALKAVLGRKEARWKRSMDQLVAAAEQLGTSRSQPADAAAAGAALLGTPPPTPLPDDAGTEQAEPAGTSDTVVESDDAHDAQTTSQARGDQRAVQAVSAAIKAAAADVGRRGHSAQAHDAVSDVTALSDAIEVLTAQTDGRISRRRQQLEQLQARYAQLHDTAQQFEGLRPAVTALEAEAAELLELQERAQRLAHVPDAKRQLLAQLEAAGNDDPQDEQVTSTSGRAPGAASAEPADMQGQLAQLQQQEQDAQKLQAKLEEANQQLAESAARLAALRQSNEQLTEAVRDLEAVEAEHEALLAKVQDLEALRRENGEMVGLLAQLQLLRREADGLGQLRQQVEALAAENVTLQATAAQLPGLRQERGRLQGLADEVGQLRREVAGLMAFEQECERLRAQAQELRDSNSDMQAAAAEVAELQKQADQLRKLANHAEALRDKNAELQQEVSELEALRTEHSRLQELALHASELRLQNGRLRELSAELPGLREEHARLQQAAEEGQQLADELRDKVQQLDSLEAEKGRLLADPAMCDELAQEISAMRQRLPGLEALAHEANLTRQQVQELQAAADTLPDLLAEAARLGEMVQQRDVISAQNASLQEEVAVLQGRQERARALAGQVEELRRQLGRLQAAADGLPQLEAEHAKLLQMAEKAAKLRSRNAEMSSVVVQLPALKDAHKRMKAMVMEMGHLKNECRDMQLQGAQHMEAINEQAAGAAASPLLEAASDATAHTPTNAALANGRWAGSADHQRQMQRQRRSASHITTTPPGEPLALVAGTPPTTIAPSASFRTHHSQVTPGDHDMVTPVHGPASVAPGHSLTPVSGGVAVVKAKLQRLKSELLSRPEGQGSASRATMEGKISKLERLIQDVEEKQAIRYSMSTSFTSPGPTPHSTARGGISASAPATRSPSLAPESLAERSAMRSPRRTTDAAAAERVTPRGQRSVVGLGRSSSTPYYTPGAGRQGEGDL